MRLKNPFSRLLCGLLALTLCLAALPKTAQAVVMVHLDGMALIAGRTCYYVSDGSGGYKTVPALTPGQEWFAHLEESGGKVILHLKNLNMSIDANAINSSTVGTLYLDLQGSSDFARNSSVGEPSAIVCQSLVIEGRGLLTVQSSQEGTRNEFAIAATGSITVSSNAALKLSGYTAATNQNITLTNSQTVKANNEFSGNGTTTVNTIADYNAGRDTVPYRYLEIQPGLTFAHSAAFDVPAGIVNTAIAPIDVSSGAFGGKMPYTFSKVSGPDWLAVNAAGNITGTRPAAAAAAITLIVQVEDDAGATASISIIVGAVTEAPKPAPAASGSGSIAGGGTYSINAYTGSWANGVLTIPAARERLISVHVDDVQLTPNRDYTVNGSTSITFTPSYLASLADGRHTLRVEFTDGRYNGSFIAPLLTPPTLSPIAAVPATGDAPWALGFAALLLCAGLALRRRQRIR